LRKPCDLEFKEPGKPKCGRPKILVSRKIFCEVIEGIVYEDRCLYKLSKILEGRTCGNCILRELERMKSGKAEGSSVDDIKDIKDIRGVKWVKGIKTPRRRTEPGPKKKAKPELSEKEDRDDIVVRSSTQEEAPPDANLV
jgi:hypothetical protein